MSKCISSEGEYSDHELAEQPRFLCARCFAFDEDAALTALKTAEATLERVRVQHRVDQYTEGRAVTRCVCEEEWPCSTMAALAPVTEEGDRE